MEIIAIFNQENAIQKELENFKTRKTARGVIFDQENNIALLHQIKKDWYGIPGGGAKENENPEQTITREVKEEIGCQIKIISNLGKILEYRKSHNLINESEGFLAKTVGQKGSPDKNDETNDSDIIWVPLVEAIKLIENSPLPKELYSQYCKERDLIFLKQAESLLK